tara:strand:- start:64 stop:225 length:162 start_codon:yes stop_codon:yes gene_type:complete
MILTFSILFAALGYFFYKSKDEIILTEEVSIDSNDINIKDEDDLFKELEDLFI